MDRLTAFVAIAHAKLRLEYLQRHPEFLEGIEMTPKFAGLSQVLGAMRHEVEAMAEDLYTDVASTRAEAKDAFGQAKQEMAKTKAAVADVKAFVADLQGSNGGPTLSDSSDTSGQSQIEPERLSVNGVAQG